MGLLLRKYITVVLLWTNVNKASISEIRQVSKKAATIKVGKWFKIPHQCQLQSSKIKEPKHKHIHFHYFFHPTTRKKFNLLVWESFTSKWEEAPDFFHEYILWINIRNNSEEIRNKVLTSKYFWPCGSRA